MKSIERKVAYISFNRLNFSKSHIFHLSGYANQSDNFTNLVFVTLSLLFSIAEKDEQIFQWKE